MPERITREHLQNQINYYGLLLNGIQLTTAFINNLKFTQQTSALSASEAQEITASQQWLNGMETVEKSLNEAELLSKKDSAKSLNIPGLFIDLEYLDKINPPWLKDFFLNLIQIFTVDNLSVIQKSIPEFTISIIQSEGLKETRALARNRFSRDPVSGRINGVVIAMMDPREGGEWVKPMSRAEFVKTTMDLIIATNNEHEGIEVVNKAVEITRSILPNIDLNTLNSYTLALFDRISNLYSSSVYQMATYSFSNIQSNYAGSILSKEMSLPNPKVLNNEDSIDPSKLDQGVGLQVAQLAISDPVKLASQVNNSIFNCFDFYHNLHQRNFILTQKEGDIIRSSLQDRFVNMFGLEVGSVSIHIMRMGRVNENQIYIPLALPSYINVNDLKDRVLIEQILKENNSLPTTIIEKYFGDLIPDMSFLEESSNWISQAGVIGNSLVGTKINDIFTETDTSGKDLVLGGAGNDRIDSNMYKMYNGDQVVHGNSGRDILTGIGPGAHLVGGVGADTLITTNSAYGVQFLEPGAGKDEIILNLNRPNKQTSNAVNQTVLVLDEKHPMKDKLKFILPNGVKINKIVGKKAHLRLPNQAEPQEFSKLDIELVSSGITSNCELFITDPALLNSNITVQTGRSNYTINIDNYFGKSVF